MTENNSLVNGILGYQLNIKMMLPQRTKEATKISEVISVSLPVAIMLT